MKSWREGAGDASRAAVTSALLLVGVCGGVVRLRPDHVLARLNLGIAQVRLNRFAEARRHFEKVLELDPENQRAQQHLASLSAMLTPAP